MKILVLFVYMLVHVTSAYAEDTVLPIFTNPQADDLAKIYELALINDPTLRAANASYKAGLENKKIARAALLPQLNAFGSYQKSENTTQGVFPITLDQDQNPITPEIRALRPVNNQSDERLNSWGASLTQTVFDLSRWFEFRKGSMETQKARMQFVVDQQDFIMRVAEAYFEVLRSGDILGISKQQEAAEKRQIKQAQQRANVGLSAETEVYQARAAYDMSRSMRLINEDALSEAHSNLSLLTAQTHNNLWSLVPTYAPLQLQPKELASWLNTASLQNFNIKVAIADKRAAKAAARSTASNHLPTINAELSYNNNNSDTHEIDDDLPFDFESTSDALLLKLSVNMPLFTGGYNSARRRQAYHEYNRALEVYAGTVKDVKRNVQILHRKAVSDVTRFQAIKQMVESNQQALVAVQKSYRVGVLGIADVLNAQRNLYAAKREFNNIYYDYILNLLRLKQWAGTLNPQDIYELNQGLQFLPQQ